MQSRFLLAPWIVLLLIVIAACKSSAKVAIEEQLPPEAPGELKTVYTVRDCDGGKSEDAAHLCADLVDHVRYELVRHGICATQEQHATRAVRLKIVDYKDVDEWSRHLLGMFAAPDQLVVDVEVLAGNSEKRIGHAQVLLSDMNGISNVSENSMVSEVALKVVDFLRNDVHNPPSRSYDER